MKAFRNPNWGKSPLDPSYDDNFNEEEELDRYYDEMDLKEERDRGN